MRTFVLGATIALMAGVHGAAAQSDNAFVGFKIGAAFDYRAIEAKRSIAGLPARIDERQAGAGYRAYLGYDFALGDRLVLGTEAGLGGGGKTLVARGPAGEYSLEPGLSYDASARLGFMPTNNVLLYGRAGYQWLKTDEKVSLVSAGQKALRRKETEGGVMYGFGGEFAATENLLLRAEYDQTNFGHGRKAAQIQLGGAFRF